MHKSRLGGFIIDCEVADLDQAAAFWAAALGLQARRSPDPEEAARYRALVGETRELHVEVQSVDHPSRVHLDIETDDINAEVQRLEALGARRIGMVKDWCVMEAPTGQRFCVIRAHSPSFGQRANRWE